MVTVRIEQLIFLEKGVSCIIEKTTQTKDHCLNCIFNDPILNCSVPFKLKPLFTKSDID